MARITMVAVGWWIVTALSFSETVCGVEPALRDVLRGNARQRHESVPRDGQHGRFPDVGQIAVEYTVQVLKQGVEVAVDPEVHRFRPGDQIQVSIRPFRDVYVYVFFEEGEGICRCLVPHDRHAPQLARHDQPVELPADGDVFEIGEGFKGAALVLVASKETSGDLASFCGAAYKQRRVPFTLKQWSPRAAQRLRNEKALAAIRDRQAQAVAYRGRLSGKVLSRVWSEMDKRGASDALLVEPPTKGEPSTLAMLVTKSQRVPSIVVRIPLKPADATAVNVPWATRR